MVNWDELKGKLNDIGDAAKKTFSAAADKTQKGAKVASQKVKVVMEENKINKAMGELGKKTYELIDKGTADITANSQVKDIVATIYNAKQTIEHINEEINPGK